MPIIQFYGNFYDKVTFYQGLPLYSKIICYYEMVWKFLYVKKWQAFSFFYAHKGTVVFLD